MHYRIAISQNNVPILLDYKLLCFNFQNNKMDENRKNVHSTSTKLLVKKSVPLLKKPQNKSHNYILSKARNTLEDTRDTLTGNKIVKSKNTKDVFSSSTQPKVLQTKSKLLENRMNTDYQNRFSILEKNPTLKSKSFLKKPKMEGETKLKLRLSLHDKKCKDLFDNSFHNLHQIDKSRSREVNLEQLAKQRENIQKDIQRSCKKNKIAKKDLLKISHQYQRLLDRFVFTEIPQNQTLQNYHSCNGVTINLSSLDRSPALFQIENQSVTLPFPKAKIKNLQLGNIKKMGIQDYNDQFMSHYQELSHSWKRDIDIQKRF